jgi:ZIP family zinc transporter
VIAPWAKPSTLFMSAVLGFTSGILLATIAFEMLPNALEHSSLALATLGFAAGFIAVYAFDLSSSIRGVWSARRLSSADG